jgi:hypothetical protein
MTNRKNAQQSNEDFLKQATSSLILAPGTILNRAASGVMTDTNPDTDTQPAQAAPVRVGGKPTDKDMEYINRLSKSGQVDPASLYVLDTAPSTQRIDTYFTRMDITSLKNYVRDALAGVPVMNSHKTGGWGQAAQLPIGRSFWGDVEADPAVTSLQRLVSFAYILRNNRANGEVNTDEIIDSIEAGIVSDVSIGFAFQPGTPELNFQDRTWLRCAVCGQDWLKADPWSEDPDTCHHWPGEIYAFDGGSQKQLCYLDLVNGRLVEYSPCYAGSTPGAVILKAQRAAESGALNRSLVNHLESVYNTRLVSRSFFTRPKPAERATATAEAKDIETQIAERKKQEMANKQALDGARQEGEQLALARLVRTFMDNRSLSDEELGQLKEIQDCIAAGDTGRASDLLTALISGGDAGDDDEGDEDDEAAADGDSAETDAQGETEASRQDEESGGTSAAAADTDTAGASGDEAARGANPGTIISLSLTASERQQFKALRDEAKALRKEVRQLKPLADIGQRYRDQLVDATVKQAVRADIPGMTEARVRRMCLNLDIEDVEAFYLDYSERAAARLGQVDNAGAPLLVGGRQTQALDPNAVYGTTGQQGDDLPLRSAEFETYKSGGGSQSGKQNKK